MEKERTVFSRLTICSCLDDLAYADGFFQPDREPERQKTAPGRVFSWSHE